MNTLFNGSLADHHKNIIDADLKRLREASMMVKAEIAQQTILHVSNALFDALAKIDELEGRIEVIKKNRSAAFDESGVKNG